MKSISLVALALAVAVIACDKPVISDSVLVDLTFTRSNTPASAVHDQDITVGTTVSGTDLCYHFSFFTIQKINPLLFEVRAKGTYPNPEKGGAVCPQAIYYKDTAFAIPASTPGKLVVRFVNPGGLFKADTVQVN